MKINKAISTYISLNACNWQQEEVIKGSNVFSPTNRYAVWTYITRFGLGLLGREHITEASVWKTTFTKIQTKTPPDNNL